MMPNIISNINLGDIAEISAGHSIRGRVEYDPKGSHLLVQIKDVDPVFGVDPTGLLRFFPKGRKAPDLLRPDDLLFVGRGNRLFGLQVGRQFEKALAAPHLFVLRIKTASIQPSYLAWFLNHARAQQYFWQHAAGTAVPHINRKVLEGLPVIVPQPDKQKSIVRAYDCWLREKALSQQILQKKQHLIAAILDEALNS